MTAIDAKLLTLAIGDGAVSESFTEIGGLRNYRIALRNRPANFHHLSLAHAWEEAMEGSGRQQITLSGEGIFTDTNSEETLREQAFANSAKNYHISLGNGDVLSGAFCVTQYDRSANMDGGIEYQLTLQSAGEVTFTAAT